MVTNAASNKWCSAEAFGRLGRAASRLGTEMVVDADADRPARELRLDRVLALCDTGLLSPAAEEGQFLWLAAVDEAVKGKVLLAAVENLPLRHRAIASPEGLDRIFGMRRRFRSQEARFGTEMTVPVPAAARPTIRGPVALVLCRSAPAERT